MADRAVADPAAADQVALGRVAVDQVAGALVAFDPAVADQFETIVADAHVETGTGRPTTARDPPATGPPLIVRDGRATGPPLIVRVPLATAHGRPATDRHSSARAGTIDPLPAAPGKLTGPPLIVRLASSVPSLIVLVETQAPRRNVSAAANQKDHRAINRGSNARGVTRDRPLTAAVAAASVVAGRTRIARAGHAPRAGASGQAARAGRRGPSTRGQRGHQTSTQASSSVMVTS